MLASPESVLASPSTQDPTTTQQLPIGGFGAYSLLLYCPRMLRASLSRGRAGSQPLSEGNAAAAHVHAVVRLPRTTGGAAQRRSDGGVRVQGARA